MALHGPIPITFDLLFPHGCYLVGEVDPVKNFDVSTPNRFVQARDKETNELLWQVAVMDADPEARVSSKTVAVKISSPVAPVPPPAPAGLPFTPVEFEGMAVKPYIPKGTTRLAYTITATGMRAPRPAPGAGKPTAHTKDGAAA